MTNRKAARPDASNDLVALAARTPGAKVLAVSAATAGKVKGRPGKNKYGAIPTTYDGARYASKAEAAYAAKLDQMVKAGLLWGWTRQVPFFLGCPDSKYVTDFVCVTAGGKPFAVDVKGRETPKFRRDKKLWKRYGFMPLQIVTGGKVVETITPTVVDWAKAE